MKTPYGVFSLFILIVAPVLIVAQQPSAPRKITSTSEPLDACCHTGFARAT